MLKVAVVQKESDKSLDKDFSCVDQTKRSTLENGMEEVVAGFGHGLHVWV